jgi:hypothetical protein
MRIALICNFLRTAHCTANTIYVLILNHYVDGMVKQLMWLIDFRSVFYCGKIFMSSLKTFNSCIHHAPPVRDGTFALLQNVLCATLQPVLSPRENSFAYFYHQRLALPVRELQTNAVVQCVLFWLLLLFSNIFLTFAHIVACDNSSVFNIAE